MKKFKYIYQTAVNITIWTLAIASALIVLLNGIVLIIALFKDIIK